LKEEQEGPLTAWFAPPGRRKGCCTRAFCRAPGGGRNHAGDTRVLRAACIAARRGSYHLSLTSSHCLYRRIWLDVCLEFALFETYWRTFLSRSMPLEAARHTTTADYRVLRTVQNIRIVYVAVPTWRGDTYACHCPTLRYLTPLYIVFLRTTFGILPAAPAACAVESLPIVLCSCRRVFIAVVISHLPAYSTWCLWTIRYALLISSSDIPPLSILEPYLHYMYYSFISVRSFSLNTYRL